MTKVLYSTPSTEYVLYVYFQSRSPTTRRGSPPAVPYDLMTETTETLGIIVQHIFDIVSFGQSYPIYRQMTTLAEVPPSACLHRTAQTSQAHRTTNPVRSAAYHDRSSCAAKPTRRANGTLCALERAGNPSREVLRMRGGSKAGFRITSTAGCGRISMLMDLSVRGSR